MGRGVCVWGGECVHRWGVFEELHRWGAAQVGRVCM